MAQQAAHILIGGGTGFVGRHLVKCLKSSGAKVRIITRKPSKSPDYISWDKIKNDGLPKETTAVVNLAGRNIFDPTLWTEGFKKEIIDSRIETNRLLVNAIHKATSKPECFVTASGVGYYAPSETIEYDENWASPENPRDLNFMMSLAKDWEKAGELDEHHAPTTRRVIIRPGAVLGHDGGLMQNIKGPFSLGLGGPFGSGQQWFPWIHIDDLANMFKFAITNDHVTGIINGVAPEHVRNKDFAKALGTALNRPVIVPIPSFMVNILFGSVRAMVMLEGMRIKSRSTLLGFRYQYPTIQDACKEIVSKH